MTSHMIPAEAVEAALSISLRQLGISGKPLPDGLLDARRAIVSEILEAAAPHMLAGCERELEDAKRVIALLVLNVGGKATIGRHAVTELSAETVIETTQDVINGGWVIRASVPTP